MPVSPFNGCIGQLQGEDAVPSVSRKSGRSFCYQPTFDLGPWPASGSTLILTVYATKTAIDVVENWIYGIAVKIARSYLQHSRHVLRKPQYNPFLWFVLQLVEPSGSQVIVCAISITDAAIVETGHHCAVVHSLYAPLEASHYSHRCWG